MRKIPKNKIIVIYHLPSSKRIRPQPPKKKKKRIRPPLMEVNDKLQKMSMH